MEKINIAELLKDCPSGMELDCVMYDNLYFDLVNNRYNDTISCYTLIDGIKTSITFTKYGTYNSFAGAKCVIFPKGKTTWEGFVPPCKFKVGDKITDKNKFIYRITEVTDKGYKLHDLKTTFITFEEADLYFVKVVDIFDINTLKPFDKVLVRDNNEQLWVADLFGFHDDRMVYKFMCVGHNVNQCIPYNDDTKHLLGTTNDCDEYYKNW